MNIKEFAEMLDGRQYTKEVTKEEAVKAKELGFVIAYGASDDLLEFRGALYDEAGIYNGGEVAIDIDKKELFCGEEGEDYCEECYKRANKIIVMAEWSPEDEEISWRISADTEFESFLIKEDDENYCRGIVFELKSANKTKVTTKQIKLKKVVTEKGTVDIGYDYNLFSITKDTKLLQIKQPMNEAQLNGLRDLLVELGLADKLLILTMLEEDAVVLEVEDIVDNTQDIKGCKMCKDRDCSKCSNLKGEKKKQ